MEIESKLTTIGIIALSLLVGLISFYIMSDLPKDQKKKHMEELTLQLINFVIFMWLGKIILNLPSFIADPLSILAYPSDSKPFYFAVLLTAAVLVYRLKRKQMEVFPFIESFIHTFLIASFVYEFIQYAVRDNTYAFGYLILLFILIGLHFFLRERITTKALIMVILTGWSLGMVILSSIQPFVIVFGYIMAPWFVGAFFLVSFSLIYKPRKRDT